MGDAADPDVLQQELHDQLEGEVDQIANGTLRLAFTAQPADAAGSWWTQQTAPYLSAPDVALNHPLRWTRISETSGPLSSVYCLNVLDRDARPRVGLALHKLDEGRLKVDLRISKASIPEPPQLCGGDVPTTDVMTRLAAIDDGTNPPLTVPIVASWECGSDRHGEVRELVLRFQR
jgi:hypothetical protein